MIGPLLGSWMYVNLGTGFLWWVIISIGIVVLPGLFIIDRMLKEETARNLVSK